LGVEINLSSVVQLLLFPRFQVAIESNLRQGKNDVRDFQYDIETLVGCFPDVTERQLGQILFGME
jgi:hypothetical protein